MSWRKHFTPVDNSGLPLNVQFNDSSRGAAANPNGVASYMDSK